MSENSKQNNQAGYNTWSSFYDTYPNPTVAADELAFPAFWNHVRNKTVLEIGCGTGRHTQKLLRQNNKVTGIDISEGMLEVAKKKLPAENLTLFNADYMTHDFAADCFDVIVWPTSKPPMKKKSI